MRRRRGRLRDLSLVRPLGRRDLGRDWADRAGLELAEATLAGLRAVAGRHDLALGAAVAQLGSPAAWRRRSGSARSSSATWPTPSARTRSSWPSTPVPPRRAGRAARRTGPWSPGRGRSLRPGAGPARRLRRLPPGGTASRLLPGVRPRAGRAARVSLQVRRLRALARPGALAARLRGLPDDPGGDGDANRRLGSGAVARGVAGRTGVRGARGGRAGGVGGAPGGKRPCRRSCHAAAGVADDDGAHARRPLGPGGAIWAAPATPHDRRHWLSWPADADRPIRRPLGGAGADENRRAPRDGATAGTCSLALAERGHDAERRRGRPEPRGRLAITL